MSLSAFLFEDAWLTSLEFGWPPVGSLQLEQVASWIAALGIGTRQLATGEPEKALFSLLHLGSSDAVDATGILWVTRALESLYDVPTALSFSVLRSRLSLVLGTPPVHFHPFLRELYDARNAFSHGGGAVSHPLGNELWDKAVDKHRVSVLNAARLGGSVLIASIQQHIRRGWKELVFTESVDGVPVREA